MGLFRKRPKKCPKCKGRGQVIIRIARGTDKDFQETACQKCYGTGYIPRS